MPLTKQEVEHVADLARLDLSEHAKEELTRELARIIEYADKLKLLDTAGVEPTARAVELSNVFREDEVGPSMSPEEALLNAPERQGGFFKVPSIMETES